MENISEHITYKEAIYSGKAIELGIENKPVLAQLYNMGLVAHRCFEPLRNWYGKPIYINSFFRNKATNTAVKGSATSDHIKGCAIDIDTKSISENKRLFDWAKENLEFDQLIWENGGEWIHISFRLGANRQQIKYLTQK